MTAEIAFRLIGGILLLLANAFFVATEFALTRLRQYKQEEIKADSGLSRAWKMTERLEIYLTGCQVGITSTSILLGVIAEPAVTQLIEQLIAGAAVGSFTSHGISIVLSVTLINFAHTIWGEQTPTYLGVEKAKTVARYCALPLYWWTKAIYPVLYMGDGITKMTLRLFGISMSRSWMEEEEFSQADLKGKIGELLKSGGLPEDRRSEVVRAMEIDEIPVGEIMVSRDDIVSLSTLNDLSENLETVRKHMQSRYPLVEDSPDHFKGVLYASEMLAHIEELQTGNITLEDLSRTDMTVPQNLPVSELIDRFQQQHQELALVHDNEKVTGLVTLTDALEVIVGSAKDPTDLEMTHKSGSN